jgi:plastocyanin
MRRLFAFASTMILGSTCVWVAGCSSNGTPSPGSAVDSGSTDSTIGSMPVDAGGGTPVDTGGGTPVTDASTADALSGTDSSTACSAPGTTVPAKFDFATTAPTLNGGKGQMLSIHVCDTVTWTNDDNAIPHSVVSTGGGFAFHTPVVTGTTAGVPLGSVQFPTAGTFTYQCGVHLAMMIGQVTVQ